MDAGLQRWNRVGYGMIAIGAGGLTGGAASGLGLGAVGSGAVAGGVGGAIANIPNGHVLRGAVGGAIFGGLMGAVYQCVSEVVIMPGEPVPPGVPGEPVPPGVPGEPAPTGPAPGEPGWPGTGTIDSGEGIPDPIPETPGEPVVPNPDNPSGLPLGLRKSHQMDHPLGLNQSTLRYRDPRSCRKKEYPAVTHSILGA